MITRFENSHTMFKSERSMQLLTVKNGIVLPQLQTEQGPMWGLGGVCDEHNRFVELSAYDGGWATHGGAYEWTDEVYEDCDAVYFGMFFNHWGHFLVDLIGRLWYFAKAKQRGQRVKLAYLGEEEPRGNFVEFFSLLGIEQDDLMHITVPTRFRQVIVPEFSCKSCEWYSEEYRSIFDHMIKAVEEEGYVSPSYPTVDKVYFSRQAFQKAKATEFGEDLIAQWMQVNGFTLIPPEKLSVREQIYIWNHATEIACLDGSIPLGLAFCGNPELRLTVFHKTHLEHLNLELYLLMRPCDVTLLDVWHEPFKSYPKSIGAGPFLFHLGDDAFAYSQMRGWTVPYTPAKLKWARRKNCVRMVWHIIDLKGKIRRIIPFKRVLRRLRSHGKA